MSAQNYGNHKQFVPLYHYFLFGLLVLSLIGSIVNVVKTCGSDGGIYSASLILVINISLILTTLFARSFALKAQDRAIRAEENMRHYLLTGKALPTGLNLRQIVGVRFASDAEFPELVQRAAKEGMSEDDIKKAVKNWRADNDRV